MGSDKTRTQYQGILVPDHRITELWSAESSLTQSGRYVAMPTPGVSNRGGTVLEGSGSLSGDISLTVRDQRSGFPRPGRGGGYVWQDAGDWRGTDTPVMISGSEVLLRETASLSISQPHMVTLSDRRVLLTYVLTNTGTAPTTYSIVSRIYDPRTNVWTLKGNVHSTQSGSGDFWPSSFEIEDGRLFCVHKTDDGENLRVASSTDDAATWTVWREQALDADQELVAANYFGSGFDAVGRVRCAYKDGEVLCLIGFRTTATGSSNHRLIQLASMDLASTFETIYMSTGTFGTGGVAPDVVAGPAGFHVGYLGRDSASSNPELTLKTRLLGSAFQRMIDSTQWDALDSADVFSTREWGDWDALSRDLELTLTRSDSGELYALAVLRGAVSGNANQAVIYTSLDDGETWRAESRYAAATDGVWWHASATGDPWPRDIAATYCAGRVLIAHRKSSQTGTEDDSLIITALGGYSTVTLPGITLGDTTRRVGWLATYLPWDEPDVYNDWSVANSGTSAATATDALNVTTTSGTRIYTYNGGYSPSSSSTGVIARARLSVTTGGITAATAGGADDIIGLRASWDDGADSYRVSVRIGATGVLSVYDHAASAQVGATVTGLSLTDSVDILLAASDDEVSVWYREAGSHTDREWTAGPTGAITSSSTGTYATASEWDLDFGVLTSATTDADWHEVVGVSGVDVGAHLVDFSSLLDLNAIPYSAVRPTWVDAGACIRAVSGPATPGDVHTLTQAYDYPVSIILPREDATPRHRWRSTADSTVQQIAYRIDAAGDGRIMSPVLALYLDGCNWRTGKLQAKTTAGSWTDIGTIDMAGGGLGSLGFERHGETVIPAAAAATGSRRIARDELVGATLALPGTLVRIDHNTEGVWTGRSNTNATQAKIIAAGLASGDSASGTCSIWSTRGVLLVGLPETSEYAGFRIQIDSQQTVDGYYTIGTAVLGPVVILGYRPGWDRSRSVIHGTELEELEDRTVHTRVRSPVRRRLEVSWTDGVDMTGTQGASPDPDYVTITHASGTATAANKPDTPEVLAELLSELDGPHTPVVYLPAIPADLSSPVMYTTRQRYLYGRVTSSEIGIEVVVGEEDDNELVRVTTVTLTEEV